MHRLRRIKYRIGAVTALVGVSVLVAACGSSSSTSTTAARRVRRGRIDRLKHRNRDPGSCQGRVDQHRQRQGRDLSDGRRRESPVPLGGRPRRHVQLLGRVRQGMAAADEQGQADRRRRGARLEPRDDQAIRRVDAGDLQGPPAVLLHRGQGQGLDHGPGQRRVRRRLVAGGAVRFRDHKGDPDAPARQRLIVEQFASSARPAAAPPAGASSVVPNERPIGTWAFAGVAIASLGGRSLRTALWSPAAAAG